MTDARAAYFEAGPVLFVEPEVAPGVLLPLPVEPEARGIVLAPPLPFIEPAPFLPSWSFIEPMLLLLPPLLIEPVEPDEEPMPLPLLIEPVEPDEEPVLLPLPLPLPIELEPFVVLLEEPD